MFGKEKIKIFVKGALGMQYSSLKREGIVTISDNDFGFYGGGGAGIMLYLKENIFINAEYEIAWASNNCYKDGWINTASGGIGFKF
jgi:opacity protein-like surface antigen